MFVFVFAFVSCIVMLSGIVVLEFEFCADADRSAPTKATETIKTNKRMRWFVVYLFTVLLLLLLQRRASLWRNARPSFKTFGNRLTTWLAVTAHESSSLQTILETF
jgi:hypothetical protein